MTEEDTGIDRKRWNELIALKQQKMKEQQSVVKELQNCLSAEDGLIESSRRVIKNLDAAIVASRQPGYFQYYEKTDKVKDMEATGKVESLQMRLKQIQREIDQATHEMDEMEARRRNATEQKSRTFSSLEQWFATYGRPKNATPGKVSSFKASNKIYGATRHHPAFKSVARSMTVGRNI